MKNSNKKGFTLVELVVVIAIIGVLAAILVPSMMGYVKKSRLKTANGNAKTAYNAIAEYVADLETEGNLTSVDNGEAATAAKEELASNGTGAGVVATDVEKVKTDGTAVWYAQWKKTDGDEIIGQYPEAPSKIADIPAWIG
ncbi:type II secretion system protein [Ruminococcus albus]|uniref:Type IV pilus assembly protein PilA n=1 Tax=Ruminococcus albus TaxID=1264 RepID=A0A1H7HVW3_RUMAL|nr:type II secretion system protein [Ruminococcus albus]SEK52355.1 type IV pilus assembly protein PilA [Ruminococcus albus]